MRYDDIIYFFFVHIPWIHGLNKPPFEIPCICSGKSLVIKKNNYGIHLLCCRCFMLWIKPTYGLPYRKVEYMQHCQHSKLKRLKV